MLLLMYCYRLAVYAERIVGAGRGQSNTRNVLSIDESSTTAQKNPKLMLANARNAHFCDIFARATHNVSADLSFFLLLSLSSSMTMAHLALVLFSPEEGKGEPCVS